MGRDGRSGAGTDEVQVRRVGGGLIVGGRCIVIPCQQIREVLLHARDHVGDLDITTELPGQGGDPRVIDAARDEAVVPRQVDVAVERESGREREWRYM